ncbi:hypothetical protein NQ315_008727 [Exocentrus adspersus]|uniref:Prominin-1-A n=1 Tax=Exocentrus adspersus TaxID=1586481 RepID=A0AAV8W7F8_9CUCU|nr:hypothetical protein NQ315_008727 [Exocentrus adspersus]
MFISFVKNDDRFNAAEFRGVKASTYSTISNSALVPTASSRDSINESLNTSSFSLSRLHFLDVPKGDDMRVSDLKLNEEFLVFEVFSHLTAFLQPAGFPPDLFRDVFNKRVPLQILAFKVLKLEIAPLSWIILWGLLSLCLPIAVAANLCCSSNIRRLDEDSCSNDSTTHLGRIIGYLLHVQLLLLLCPILLILAGNEQISKSISRSPSTVDIIYEDVNTFVRNTHMQLSFVVTSSVDIAIEAIRKDLEGVDVLLARPYQQELSAETGIDVALLELEDLKASTFHVTSLITEILNECSAARVAASVLQDQLADISRQLTVVRQQCGVKDRALCYTLQQSGFDVAFSVDNLTNDVKIRQLERFGSEELFNASVDAARKVFAEVPDQIAMEASIYVADMKALFSRRRTQVYKSTHALDVLTRSLSKTLRIRKESASALIRQAVDWDLWRWLSVLGIALLLALTWGLLLCGAPCGCGLTSRTVAFLLAGLGLSCVACIAVWVLGSVALLAGGHGESLLCRPLYDKPHYKRLAELVKVEGELFGDGGVFQLFQKGNDSLNVAEVLKNCERDQPVYQIFRLYNQIDVNKVTNHREWEDLKRLFSNFTAEENSLEILGPALQLNLQILSSLTATANLTTHRTQISVPTTRRDLNSFADQLNTVASQLSDPISARRIDNLAFSVRRVVHNELRRLAELRNRILYQITTLEVLLPPLSKQVNQSLSHLKDVQYFLDNEAWQVSERVRRRFVSRIESYLDQLNDHVNVTVTKGIGRCRPVWNAFHASRFQVCKLTVDPMNGVAFSSFSLMLLFLTIAPVVLKLVEHYRDGNEDTLSSTSHGRSFDETWASPSSSTPEMPSSRDAAASAHADSPPTPPATSPGSRSRRPSNRQVPVPPRPPSAISARIQSARSTTPKTWI